MWNVVLKWEYDLFKLQTLPQCILLLVKIKRRWKKLNLIIIYEKLIKNLYKSIIWKYHISQFVSLKTVNSNLDFTKCIKDGKMISPVYQNIFLKYGVWSFMVKIQTAYIDFIEYVKMVIYSMMYSIKMVM